MADIIQANFDDLTQVAARFGTQSENTAQSLQSITRAMDKLQNGDWIGRGSDAFFAEMEQAVLPAVRRLLDALTQAKQVTNEISALIQQAEEEAAAPFRNGSSMDTAGNNNAVERFANLASAVYPANPGAQAGGAWRNGAFQGDGLDANQWEALTNERGFSAGTGAFGTLDGNFAGADGWGSGSSGIDTAGDDYGIPRDWLADVKGAFNNHESREFGIPRDWLAGIMDSLKQDLDSATATEAAASESTGGGSGGGSEGGGSAGGGSGSGAETGAPPTEATTPMTGGGGGGSGSPQSQVTDPYGRGNDLARGYGQTTVSAADKAEQPPSLRYQSLGGGGGRGAPSDPALARPAPTMAGSANGGQTPSLAVNDGGLRGLSIGIAAVGPLLALAGKMLQNKLTDNEK